MARRPHVAVLGAGILGSSAALHLVRRGATVTLFDRAPAPFSGASRWNEGKIHLGFLYCADPSLSTARAILPGGLAFKDQLEQLTGLATDGVATPQEDLYLVHRDSVIPADAIGRYFGAVAAMLRSDVRARRYLTDVSDARAERLTAPELESLAEPAVIAAGFRVPERSVNTNLVADAFVAALGATPRIELAMRCEVDAVSRTGDRWHVRTSDERHGPFDAVVNALWEGRPRIDRTIGHEPDVAPQHRYRLSLFVRTRRPVAGHNAVISIGPYGDVKSYGGLDHYLSWYPAGLVARSESVDPPPVPPIADDDRRRLAGETFTELGRILPWVRRIEDDADTVRVEGGWIYSQGRGRLDDPRAGVHDRSRFGITRQGTYVSVDTGKYSVAPSLGDAVASMIVGD